MSKEVFMAIRALYEIKDALLALIVDMYKNALRLKKMEAKGE